MKKERTGPDLNHSSLKEHPFRVPEGYFEGFPGRLKARISEMEGERIPVRRIGRAGRLRIAIAAAIVGLALITYPLVRNSTQQNGETNGYTDLALMEVMGVFDHDYELAGYLEPEATVVDDEEAFLNQAIEYLAMNDVEMDLFFE